ncbi:B-box zinc finger protein 22 isoform X2 [Helianthus annuus]|uniref:B-box zinc finger protein 22 isoform X2 n=1 Tax=Helianthus annuus TaxID=4232 RepID=UPI001652BF0F|nr:B-box zinc finger protein 22 isoform X2 [Helianthus annuus]
MMKIQCNVCESVEATVFCCADDAALCRSCDEKIHAANRLASKHQRVHLSNLDNQRPKCDICQEPDGYFFCLEDRALLCRKCDAAIHKVNALVSSHQRFLLTGVKIGVETETRDLGASSSTKSLPCEKVSEAPEFRFGGGSLAEQWHFDESFGLNDLNQDYDYIDDNSSKADSGKIGGSDCSSTLKALEVEMDSEDCLGQVPDSSRMVPQISSPPTASGLCWPKHHHHGRRRPRSRRNQGRIDPTTFVPDVCYSNISNLDHSQQQLKRRKYL